MADSDTDPDMPQLIAVEVQQPPPVSDRPSESSSLAMMEMSKLGRGRRWCLERSAVDAEEEGRRRALRVLEQFERSENNKINMMRQRDDTKRFESSPMDYWKMPEKFSDEIHTVPGGLSSTTAVKSCARPGCEKPSRGTGGTSKYCSLACLEADESDEEDASLPSARTHSEQQPIAPTIPSNAESMTADAKVVEDVSESALTKSTAVSLEAFEANLQSALPLSSLIFLDVDGVLNTTGENGKADDCDVITSATPMMMLNRICLQRLVRLVQETEARLVLSSTWRQSVHLKADLWEALVAEGLPNDAFIGQTPIIECSLRHYEIKEWLDKHADMLTSHSTVPWVVLDDMRLDHAAELKGHFMHIDPTNGLSEEDLDKAASVLLMCVQCET